MSRYTTGEMAKLCGVTVRTVQFYDRRGILIPSALTQGGLRLYSAEDVKRMKIICFLRDTGLSLDTDVFDGCTKVYVYGIAGSPAEAYCLSHGNCVFVEDGQD